MKKPRCEHGVIVNGQHFCRPCIKEAFALRDQLRSNTIIHTFPLREGVRLRIPLPVDLTKADVDRVVEWMTTLVTPDGATP